MLAPYLIEIYNFLIKTDNASLLLMTEDKNKKNIILKK